MTRPFEHKTILITGAGRGLGRHLTLHLLERGATVGAIDLDRQALASLAQEAGSAGDSLHTFIGDVGEQVTLASACEALAAVSGRIDAIVNNAMLLYYCPIEEVDAKHLDPMLAVGVRALFWSAQALLRHYDPTVGACLINLASPVAQRGFPGTAIYSAVKGAIISFTRSLAAELGPRGIRTNAVSPGSVPTPGALQLNTPDVYEKRAAANPLRRNATEADFSRAVAFLLSEDAEYINGEVLNVDGGASACA